MKKFSLLGLIVLLFAISMTAKGTSEDTEPMDFDIRNYCEQMCSEGARSPSIEDLDRCLAACMASFK